MTVFVKVPKIKGVLRGNCCETFHNIPQKTPKKEFTRKEFFNALDDFSEHLHQEYLIKLQ